MWKVKEHFLKQAKLIWTIFWKNELERYFGAVSLLSERSSTALYRLRYLFVSCTLSCASKLRWWIRRAHVHFWIVAWSDLNLRIENLFIALKLTYSSQERCFVSILARHIVKVLVDVLQTGIITFLLFRLWLFFLLICLAPALQPYLSWT